MIGIKPKYASILFSITFAVTATLVWGEQPEAWQQKHEQLQKQQELIFTLLEDTYENLKRRVLTESPALMSRLSLEPAKPRATGYGLLPEIRGNASLSDVVPKETLYSLKWLERRLTEELKKAKQLDELVQGTTPVEELIVRFDKSLKRLRNLENNLSYHAKWQKAVVQYPEYYRKKNKLVVMAREMNSLIVSDAPPEQITEMRQQLLRIMAPFKPTPGLQILSVEEGEMILPVTVCTDIGDSNFLRVFQEGVHEAFSLSPAARTNRLSIELEWRLISAKTLYPDSVPERGASIDMKAHHALFTDCPLVLTTGATSLNARVGSRIFLGTRPVSPRTLAHEFGHLLGFEDAYVRGYDGEPGDPYGVVIIEWTGLSSDLMGDSGRGQVSEGMINKLIEAYNWTMP